MNDLALLLTAIALGFLIGLERKLNDHETGIHTHALGALGAALFMLLGSRLAASTETARMASQIVMGSGFLCAAVIMRDGAHLRGLNMVGAV